VPLGVKRGFHVKGVINKGIQDLVEGRFGRQAWNEIKARAGCKEPLFAVCEDYPDEMTRDLAAAAADVLRMPLAAVMKEFGRSFVTVTLKASYPAVLALAGRSAREFLLNLNRIHDTVTRSLPGACPPRFTYEEHPGGRLLMHYHSRRGLCAALEGLILGVGELCGDSLEVREVVCIEAGAPHCIMEITFR